MRPVLTKEFLQKEVMFKIDRPLGTTHPEYPDFVYELNYGYIPGVFSEDEEELDCYILGYNYPMETEKEYRGKCIAIVHRLNDNEDKLVLKLLDDKKQYTDEEILNAVHFQEQWFESVLIR